MSKVKNAAKSPRNARPNPKSRPTFSLVGKRVVEVHRRRHKTGVLLAIACHEWRRYERVPLLYVNPNTLARSLARHRAPAHPPPNPEE